MVESGWVEGASGVLGVELVEGVIYEVLIFIEALNGDLGGIGRGVPLLGIGVLGDEKAIHKDAV